MQDNKQEFFISRIPSVALNQIIRNLSFYDIVSLLQTNKINKQKIERVITAAFWRNLLIEDFPGRHLNLESMDHKKHMVDAGYWKKYYLEVNRQPFINILPWQRSFLSLMLRCDINKTKEFLTQNNFLTRKFVMLFMPMSLSLKNSINSNKDLIEILFSYISRNEENPIPLHLAVALCHMEKINEPCSFSTINSVDSKGYTAIHLAIELGNFEIIELLVKNGADIHLSTTDRSNPGIAPIFTACINGRLDILTYLHQRGASIYQKDTFGYSLIHIAARCGHIDIVKYLIHEDISLLNVQDNRSATPISECAGHVEILKYLHESGASINEISLKGLPSLETLQYLHKHNVSFDTADNNGNTILLRNIEFSDYKTVNFLCDIGVNINARNNLNESCLYLALKGKEYNGGKLCKAVKKPLMLLLRGADIDNVNYTIRKERPITELIHYLNLLNQECRDSLLNCIKKNILSEISLIFSSQRNEILMELTHKDKKSFLTFILCLKEYKNKFFVPKNIALYIMSKAFDITPLINFISSEKLDNIIKDSFEEFQQNLSLKNIVNTK